MSIFSIFSGKPAPSYPTDIVQDAEGNDVKFTFFKHASFSIQIGQRHIYNDPVLQYAEYARLPKADMVLVTHSHYDHLDRAAIDDITTNKSIILCDKTSAEVFDGEAVIMTPGLKAQPWEGVTVEAVAAYNTSEGHTDFHPQAREDCGYILELATGLRIYIAGDTELTPEMKALKNIDVAFLPVNQPYTMTVDQAIEAIKAIRPRIFYPYHYGEVDEVTDIERLKSELEEITDVRVFPME
ncbi:MAG: MBL fold metallo-hydrolase [Alistipes sp.]|nr:MBL fold metallo-hydrolase [Alistipes sp.]